MLKPLEEEAFINAINKYHHLYEHQAVDIDWNSLRENILGNTNQYKQRFLVKTGNAFTYLKTSDIKLLFSEDGLTFAINQDNKKVHLDKSLDKIDFLLNPEKIFRISRKYIIGLGSITKIHPYLNNRLKIELNVKSDHDLVVSREKVKAFKSWIDA